MKLAYAAVFLTFVIVGCAVVARQEPTLLNPPVPFAVQEVVRAMPEPRETHLRKDTPWAGETGRQYAFVCGDNMLFAPVGNEGAMLRLTTQGLPLASFSYWASTQAGWGHPFNNSTPDLQLDQAAKSITATRKFQALAENDSIFTAKARLLDDGLIELDYSCDMPAGGKLTDSGLFITFSSYDRIAGMKMMLGDKAIRFSADDAPPGDKTLFEGTFTGKIVLFPDHPEKTISFDIPQSHQIYIKEYRKVEDKGIPHKYNAAIRIWPAADGSNRIKLDIRNTSPEALTTSDSFAGINFWKDNRMHVPDFAAGRNLLQNSSFEAGLHYYDNGVLIWGTWPGTDRQVYDTDDTAAKFGHRSLRITAWKDYPQPSSLETFTVPTIPGHKYTFSFYAKADSPKQWIDVACVSGEWMKFPPMRGFGPDGEWKRYSGTFTAPNAAAILVFRARNQGNQDVSHTWIDGLQLEEGETATDYVEPAVDSILLTADPDNFLKSSQPVQARLRISAAPDTQGSVSCSVEDIFYHTLWRGDFVFTTDARGDAVLELPLDGKLGTGVFMLRTDFTLAGGVKKSDFHRLAVMDPAPQDFKHRMIFSADMGSLCRSEALAARRRFLGIGSTSYNSRQDIVALNKRYGIVDTACGTIGYGPAGEGRLKKDRADVFARCKTESYSDKLRDDVEKVAYEMTLAYPWIDAWFLNAENSASVFKVLADRDNPGFVQLLIATYRGVKRADPSKRAFLDGGPANMFPNGGIRNIDQWLSEAAKLAPDIKFDGIAVHPYRQTPEDPDLDADTQSLLEVLKKHGYTRTPIYWNEGIYHSSANIPQWGLTPYKGCSMDHWRAGTPTYHMGWGERISAAYFARSWLVALKYGDRVKQFNGWCGKMDIDYHMAPLALQKIPNTLARLLGNSVFKKDIRFAVNCRAYVFDDGTGRPVAALWSSIPNVDRGFEPSPVAKMKFTGMEPQFIDLMENPLVAAKNEDGTYDVPVTPFPLFIRGKAGDLDRLCQTISDAILTGSGDFALSLDMQLESRDKAGITLANRLSHRFSGTVTIEGKTRKLELAENASMRLDISITNPLPADRIAEVSLPVEVSESGGDTLKKDFSLRAFAVTHRKSPVAVTGNIKQWKDIPGIKLTNRQAYKTVPGTVSAPLSFKAGYPGDLDAECKMAWDADNIYLCVKVVDDKPFFPQGDNHGGDWTFDSIQIYFDTLGDNAARKFKSTFDTNDYSYTVSHDADTGQARVYRQAAPEQQIAGGLDAPKPNRVEPGIKAKVTMTSDGYVYELAFPRRLIAPLRLERNSFSRFGLMVNDNDGDGRKGGLVNTETPGSEPFANPEQWPGVLLDD
ncbi:MAG: sugar-binding protein [Phycisphaerales bacterium]